MANKFVLVAAIIFQAAILMGAEPVAAPRTAGHTLLPQQQPYQKELRTFLGTLKEVDFLPAYKDPTVVPLEGDAEDKFRMWILSLQPPAVGRKRNHSSVMIKPALFTLDVMEGPTAIMRPPAHPEPLVELADWNYAGNPYFDSRPLRLRAFALCALDMIMWDNLAETAGESERITQDLLAGSIGRLAYVYPGFRQVIPAGVRDAYRTGLKRLVRAALDPGSKVLPVTRPGIHARMTPALALAAKVLQDPDLTRQIEARARLIFTEEEFFRPAGYFPHGGTLDSFNGMSTYYALWAALASDWPFAREAISKSFRLRAHLTLPEPDGVLVGPSHMASLTSAETIHDQWDSRKRAWAAAMISDDAVALTKMPSETEIQNAAAATVAELRAQLHELSWAPHGLQPAPWKPHATGMLVNFAYQHYPNGFYAHRIALEKQQDQAQLPVLREENFIRTFGDEFVVAKTPAHAAIIHTGPIGDPNNPDAGFGFGGGALSAFWTRATGAVILGRGIGSWSPAYKTMLDQWRVWPAHAVIGMTAGGKVFTSARIIKPDATVESDGKSYTVTASGRIPQSRPGGEKLLSGVIDYTRKFESTAAGMRITTTLTGDGQDEIAELYEALPVFLRDNDKQRKLTPTLIELRADGKWMTAADTYSPKVTEIRLTRFEKAVTLKFDRPRRVKLAPADWSDAYQTRAACRNVLIDLLENGDAPATVKAASQISYRIEAISE